MDSACRVGGCISAAVWSHTHEAGTGQECGMGEPSGNPPPWADPSYFHPADPTLPRCPRWQAEPQEEFGGQIVEIVSHHKSAPGKLFEHTQISVQRSSRHV